MVNETIEALLFFACGFVLRCRRFPPYFYVFLTTFSDTATQAEVSFPPIITAVLESREYLPTFQFPENGSQPNASINITLNSNSTKESQFFDTALLLNKTMELEQKSEGKAKGVPVDIIGLNEKHVGVITLAQEKKQGAHTEKTKWISRFRPWRHDSRTIPQDKAITRVRSSSPHEEKEENYPLREEKDDSYTQQTTSIVPDIFLIQFPGYMNLAIGVRVDSVNLVQTRESNGNSTESHPQQNEI